MAMAAAQYEGLIGAIEKHHALASEGVLAEARAMRERLHKKRKQESQKLRRKHAAEMEMQSGSLSKLSVHEVTQSPPAAGSPTAEAAPASVGQEAPSAPPVAVALTLAELMAATDGFEEQRLIGSGGYGRVFTADALSSLRPAALPLWLRHKPVAVKRAKSGVHDLADLQREVRVLQQCSHPHLLPLLGSYLEHEAPCLVFPLMRGGSFADRLWPKEADPEHLRRLGLGASPCDPRHSMSPFSRPLSRPPFWLLPVQYSIATAAQTLQEGWARGLALLTPEIQVPPRPSGHG